MERRRFLQTMAGAGAGAAAMAYEGLRPGPATAQAGQETEKAKGVDLSGWRTVLGDGLYTGPGQTPPTVSDLRTTHHGSHSTLEANIHKRGVMAHNITFDKFVIDEGLGARHHARTWFRIPKLPTSSDWDYNCQTLEIGVFVWDGANTRNDYGVAIQWVLNPWIPEFGQIRSWTNTEAGPQWVASDYLEPDTEWHKFQCVYRPGGKAQVRLDNKNDVDVEETVTLKSPTWGPTIDARFQVEIVSVWPGVNSSVPPMSAEFRDWRWMVVP